MRLMTMHLNFHSKSFDSGSDLYPIYSPPSPSSPIRSLYQRHTFNRRRKIASESIANDPLKRNLRHPSPDSAGSRIFAMPEEGTSSAEEDPDLSHSTRSMGPGYLPLSAKDRLKSVSLEWTLSNGSVTPRASHYHTHPPLDFKSLKEKLEQLTGSPDDATNKHLSGVTGHERRKGVLTTLPAAAAVTNPTGGHAAIDAGRKTGQELETKGSAGTDLFQNVPYVTIEPLKRMTSEDFDSKLITREFPMKSISQLPSKSDRESSDKFEWSDLAQHVAQKDGRLQEILKRHSQELDDLKRRHELQREELRHRISESVAEDLQRNGAQQRCSNEEGRDQLSLLSSGVDLVTDWPGVFDGKQTNEHSLNISDVVAQSGLSEVGAVDGETAWRGINRCVDGVINPDWSCGVPQHLPTPARSQQLATPSMTAIQPLTENQAFQQLELHIWRDLVDRTLNQQKVSSMLLQQVQPPNWHQLEMLQRLQAAGALEQRTRQQFLQQVSPLEAQTQSAKFRCNRSPNNQCHCARPCDFSQSFPPYTEEHSYPAEPSSFINWNGCSGISYTPNYGHGLHFPKPSAIQQSPCNEVSSYYCRDNIAFPSKRQVLCCSPDQMACLLQAARNNLRTTASPLILTPPPTPMPPLLSHLVARYSPLFLDGVYPPSLRPSPLGLPLLPPQTLFQLPPDIRQFFLPLNPFAT